MLDIFVYNMSVYYWVLCIENVFNYVYPLLSSLIALPSLELRQSIYLLDTDILLKITPKSIET